MPGSQPSQTLSTRISNVAETNSGMVMAKIARVEAMISGRRSRHSPLTTPRSSASGMPTAMAQKARSREFFSRSPTIVLILVVPSAARPRSPVIAPCVHSAKRSIGGRFRSRSLRLNTSKNDERNNTHRHATK